MRKGFQIAGIAGAVEFKSHNVAEDIRGAYQVLAFDLRGDCRPQPLALGHASPDVYWFENPS